MKKQKAICSSLLLLAQVGLCSWGFFAHKLINQAAVYSLPVEIAGFYKKHITYISEHATDPDKRCYIDTLESPRHYIDLDDLEPEATELEPIHWTQAKEKFTERKLLSVGIIPWQIERSYKSLSKAMYEKDLKKILRYSADLGHYVSDAHVPLHTTKNYNGQYSNQVGIHAFWETRIPERYAETFNLWVGKSSYIKDVLECAWSIIQSSHSLVDSVLNLEKELSSRVNQDQKYAFVTRNNILSRNYSEYYTATYHQLLNGMVERRLRASILMTANLWYTAWIDAGQPDLLQIKEDTPLTTDSLAATVGTKKILGRTEWH